MVMLLLPPLRPRWDDASGSARCPSAPPAARVRACGSSPRAAAPPPNAVDAALTARGRPLLSCPPRGCPLLLYLNPLARLPPEAEPASLSSPEPGRLGARGCEAQGSVPLSDLAACVAGGWTHGRGLSFVGVVLMGE